ncbi:GvpL/GvpF family gas vesicle protein [Neobacillus bataviensis]|uniref:GvpL/GvpF family gas vesicle protein n=1 Tax=Neobacillus bataviensis TaxID=220685 RepID=UPI001CBF5B4E|nr:GvpL/GvpF family gas vesicle protein [Neobacillus bataviensis]
MSTQNRVYVFCAIREKEPKHFGKVTLNNLENKVYTIHHQNIAMVVSKVKGEVLPDRNNLFAHQNMISEIIKSYGVIPMSFGNVLHSEEDVLLILKHMHDEFDKLFTQLENKIELGLKVIAKKSWINEEMKNNPTLNKWQSSKIDISNPASFYDQIQLGEQAQNFILGLENDVEKEIYTPLLELAEAGKLNATIPGKTLLNAAFLVDRKKEEAFDQQVNDVYELWKDKVDFKYTGPWPAYNFVDIRLRIEGK